MSRRTRIAYVLYAVFVAVYLALFFIDPAFGPIDDHNFTHTVLVGEPMPLEIIPELGRFFPLDGQEYNLVGLFSTDPFWFYAFNAVQFLIFAFVITRLLRGASDKVVLIVGIPMLLFLSPGFIASWFRLLVPERGGVLFFGLFLLLYLKSQTNSSGWLVGLTLVFANLALYYKEPGFLLLGAFAGSHLALTWKTSPRRTKVLDWLLLASCGVFLIVYYLLVFSQRGGDLYTDRYGAVFAFLPRAVFSYTTTDPAMILGLLPLAAFRTWRVARRIDKPHPLYDPMILGSVIYVLAYFVLEIRATYYLLPAYVFALPALVYFATEYWSKRPTRGLAAIVLAVYVVSALPIGLFTLTQYKYVPINFTKTIDFLATDLQQGPADDPPVVFLEAINRGSGLENYESLRRFLEYENASFDIGSDLPVDNEFLYEEDPNSPYVAYSNREPASIESGDYLVVCESCINSVTVNEEYLAGFEGEYELRFATESPLAIPEYSLRNLAKLVVSEFLSGANGDALMDASENLFRGPDYYVFVKK
jgi:hypothetical protein